MGRADLQLHSDLGDGLSSPKAILEAAEVAGLGLDDDRDVEAPRGQHLTAQHDRAQVGARQDHAVPARVGLRQVRPALEVDHLEKSCRIEAQDPERLDVVARLAHEHPPRQVRAAGGDDLEVRAHGGAAARRDEPSDGPDELAQGPV